MWTSSRNSKSPDVRSDHLLNDDTNHNLFVKEYRGPLTLGQCGSFNIGISRGILVRADINIRIADHM